MHGVHALARLAGIFGMAAMLAGIAPGWGQSRALSATPTCHLEVLGTGRVQAVVDGRSFVLEDGREIRLPGIEVPLPPLPGETGARAEAGAAARAALEVMVAGQTVELRHELAAADRYGRILAHAYFVADGKESSAALEMIAAGFARVSAHVGGMQCAAELLGREREARPSCWAANARRAREKLACGAKRIIPLWAQRITLGSSPNEANSQSQRARW
jgi:endonuclease YncB( thermonuclease family)